MGEQGVYVGCLYLVYGHVVAVTEGVEFAPLAIERHHLRLVVEGWQLGKVEVMGMEGEGRNGIVGMGVGPGVGTGGVGYGEELYHLHPHRCCPLGETFQVAEVAHAIPLLRPQREEGHGHTGGLPHLFLHAQGLAVKHEHLSVAHLGVKGGAVVTVFPSHEL